MPSRASRSPCDSDEASRHLHRPGAFLHDRFTAKAVVVLPLLRSRANNGRDMGLVGVESRVRLVGRGLELDVLRAIVDEAATGRVRMVLVEGEPGIGKTRLIAEALGFARSRGFRVFSGACDELEQDSPLRALREALEIERGAPDPERAELARLLHSGAREKDAYTEGTADA